MSADVLSFAYPLTIVTKFGHNLAEGPKIFGNFAPQMPKISAFWDSRVPATVLKFKGQDPQNCAEKKFPTARVPLWMLLRLWQSNKNH